MMSFDGLHKLSCDVCCVETKYKTILPGSTAYTTEGCFGNVTDPRSRVCLACLNESGEWKGDSESRAERNRDKQEAPLDASLA